MSSWWTGNCTVRYSYLTVSRNTATDYKGVCIRQPLPPAFFLSLKTFSSVLSPHLILPRLEKLFPQLWLIFKDSSLPFLSFLTSNVPFICYLILLLWISSLKFSHSLCPFLDSKIKLWPFESVFFSFPFLFFFYLIYLLLLPSLDLWLVRQGSCSTVQMICRGNWHGGFASINILPRDIFHFQWVCWAWL